jgi:WS/DGAT/MGAT family acyltransferase
LDTAFLFVESPTAKLHTMGVMVLDPSSVPGGYCFEKLRDFIDRRLPVVPPLRRRLCEVPFGLAFPLLVDAPDIDIEYHVRRAAIPSPGGPLELAELAAEIDERPLDRGRPLWEMVVVEGLAGGHIAVLAKIQHALMDGIAGMQFMAAFFSAEPEAEEPPESASEPAEPLPSDFELLAGAVPSLLFQPLRLARAGRNTLSSLFRSRIESVLSREPEEPSVPVPCSSFNKRTSAHRKVAFVSLPLADVKAVARGFDATVNDVVLATVSGALRRYLIPRGALPKESLVAAVPASTHSEGDGRSNAYTVYGASLASDCNDPAERLRAIRGASRKKRSEQRQGGLDALVEWTEVPSPFLFSLIARAYTALGFSERISHWFNLVISNVPGPPTPLHFGGARLLGIHPLGPIYDGLTINITAISREDALDVGLVACREGIPDLWEIADALSEALAELTALLPLESSEPVPAPGAPGDALAEEPADEPAESAATRAGA